MSGNIFDTERMNTEELTALKQALWYILTDKPRFPIHFYKKDSHGDLDVFLSDTKLNRMEVLEMASNAYALHNDNMNSLTPLTDFSKYNSSCEPKERYIVQSENQYQLRVKQGDKWRHIDVTFVPSECVEFAFLYYSYGDLSQLLQMWLRSMNLELKHTGLYYELQTEGKKHLVRLTTNWYSVLDILHLPHAPYKVYHLENEEAAFEWLSESFMFTPKMINIKENDHRRSRPLFQAYLNYEFSNIVNNRMATADCMHTVLTHLPEAFTLIMNAKMNALSDASVSTKAYAISALKSINHFKQSNFDNTTNLNIIDEEGYVKIRKTFQMDF